MPEIAIGRKEIMKVLHVQTWLTVKRWRRAGLPIRYLPNQKPLLLLSEAKEWMIAYDTMLKKKTKP